jgi:NADPH-dependent curcumin reductase CurA
LDEKCKYVENLGVDRCLSYKSKSFKKGTLGPKFVRVYFDNVRGKIWTSCSRRRGRVM